MRRLEQILFLSLTLGVFTGTLIYVACLTSNIGGI